MSGSKSSALGLITIAYVLCIAAAAAVLWWGGLPQPWDAFAASPPSWAANRELSSSHRMREIDCCGAAFM